MHAHLPKYPCLSTSYIRTGPGNGVLPWIGQDGCQQRALLFGDLVGRFSEIMLGRSFRAIDSGSKLHDVQIDGHDPPLGPEQFDQSGKIKLQTFSYPASPGPEKQIFGCLLADGAGSSGAFGAFVVFDGFLDRPKVKTPMQEKVLIFSTDHSGRQMSADLIQWNPIFFQDSLFTIRPLFYAADHH